MDSVEIYRPLLFSIAYRMLGSVTEAEDMVQETFIRYQAIPAGSIQMPKAFLSKVITNLCLDHLNKAQVRREAYVGTWLPEPLMTNTDPADNPEQTLEQLESISIAFLLLLEKLSPAERAIFVLHNVFDYDYHEIAEMLNKSEAACRQLFSRAKQHIADNRPRFHGNREAHETLLMQFLETLGSGDVSAFAQRLAEDVVVRSDGGGKVVSALHPIYGREAVTRFFAGLFKRRDDSVTLQIAQVNGQSGFIFRQGETVVTVMLFEADDQFIRAVHLIRNPDKLAHLG